MQNIKAVESPTLSQYCEPRYVIIDEDTGEILDDAQGYGYKSKQKAHAAWAYLHRDKSQDNAKREKAKLIKKWLKEHKSFERLMTDTAFRIQKGSFGPDDTFNTETVKQLLKEHNLEPEGFTAYELLKVWRKGWRLKYFKLVKCSR